jgi:hypothetical protein
MLKGFKTKELIFIAILGAIVFAFDILFITSIEALVGIPGIGVLVDTIFVVGIATIGGLVVKKFGLFTGWSIVYSALAIPTNIIGPPGIYKLLIGLILGFVADLIVFAFKYKKVGYYLSLAIANTLCMPFILFLLLKLGLPGADQLAKAIWIFIPVAFIESLIGAWLGIRLYEKKLSKTKIVRQIGN